MEPTALAVAGVASLSGFLLGYNTGIIAPTLDPLSAAFDLGTMAQQIVATSILLGGMVGAIASGPLTRRYGQRPVLICGGLIYLVFAVGCAASPNFALLVASRTCLGLAVGISSMATPLYVGETSPMRRRGAFVSLIQLFITLGILVSYLVGYAVSDEAWRSMFALGGVGGIVMAATMILLPESPRWLFLQGRSEEALGSLTRLLGPAAGQAEFRAIEASMSEDEGNWSDLLGRRIRPVLIVAAMMFAFQNLSGIDAIIYYSPKIFSIAGFEGRSAQLLSTMGIGTINVLATIVSLWLVDRVGRRPLLIGGLVPMTLAMAALALSLHLGGPETGYAAVASLAVFVAFFAISLGPLPFVLMAEIFPLRVRSLGMSVAASSLWILNMAVTLTFLSLLETVGSPGTFLLFSAICAVALVFAYRTVPETRGRSLEAIEANVEAGVPTRLLGSDRVSGG
jgi:sugar porter (SP) family MFS transporter